MNGASKILTVSYGTFSCTLEGFDDPFNTMRAIAEYFRDLAADDRYFGAEPATPDAAMLHKIAEREINRRVEAKIGENGVSLRAEEVPLPRVTMPAVQPAFHNPVLAPSVADVAAAAPSMESAAARLSRLRAAQSQILAPTPASAPGDINSRFTDVEAYAEDQDAAASFKPAPFAVTAEPVLSAAIEPPVAETVVADIPINLIKDFDHPAPVADESFADPVPSEESQADAELIASLSRPVAAAEPEAKSAPAATEPVLDSLRETLAGLIGQDFQLAEDMASATADAQSAGAAELELSDDVLPEDAAEIDDLADMAQFDVAQFDVAQFDVAAEPVDQSDLDDMAELDQLAALDDLAPIIDDAAYLQTEAEAEPVAAAIEVPDPALDEAAIEAAGPAEIAASPEAPIVVEKVQVAVARVIRIRRLDKKTEDDAAATVLAAEPVTATLSPEAEAELQSTLAALEAQSVPVPDEDAELDDEISVEAQLDADLAAAEAATATTAMAPAVAPRSQVIEKASESKLAAADDAAVDRLLAQTNSELEVPETKRRRSAIAHLKAAVLATVADRRINPKAKAIVAEVKMDPYRKDLDKAVRPSSPLGSGDRPAPLVLVSAQRIDRMRDAVADANRPVPQIVPQFVPSVAAPQPGPAMPVRPRRVSSGGLARAVSTEAVEDDENDLTPDALGNIFAAEGKPSFAEFAESLGASSLSELIEAAGAYCTLVLERPSFTRPLLFQQISTMPQLALLNREDSLRGFGKLLRDGRIQKTVRGQFALSATSPILTEAKRIAG